VGGNDEAEENDEEDEKKDDNDGFAWDLPETVKMKNPPKITDDPNQKEEPPAPLTPNSARPSAIPSHLSDPNRLRSMSDPAAIKANGAHGNGASNGNKPQISVNTSTPAASSPPSTPTSVPQNPTAAGNAGAPGQPARPSALTSVIYPVLSKLLKTNQEEPVIAALAQLKIAFDSAERAKPGITHSMIAQIIETLKR